MSHPNTSGMEIDENGNINVFESSQERESRIRRERLERIRELITEDEYDPAEASRMIAVEIARVAESLSDFTYGVIDSLKLKVYSEQLKALRELGKQLNDADNLSKRDILNVEGPKFVWILEQIVDNFTKAMKEAGVQESTRNSVMKHYRDNMSAAESQIKKDVQKIS